jgi:hypothetical protein
MSDPTPEPTLVEPTPQPEPASTPATEPTGPDYKNLINSDGTFSEDFFSSLPEDIGSHSSVKKYTNIVDALKGGLNASSLASKKAEDFLASDDPAVVAKRNELMGVPSDAAGYELKKPEGLPEGLPYDEDSLGAFAEFAAENKIPKALAEKLIEFDAKRAADQFNSMDGQIAEQREKAESILREKWGNKYEYNLGKVTQATDHLGITQTLNEAGLGNNPAVIEMVFNKLIPAISDDRLIESAKSDNYATITDELDDIDNRLMGMGRDDPAGKPLIARKMELLNKLA